MATLTKPFLFHVSLNVKHYRDNPLRLTFQFDITYDDQEAAYTIVCDLWPEAEKEFNATMDGGCTPLTEFFGLSMYELPSAKALAVVEYFRQPLIAAGYECGPISVSVEGENHQ